LTGAFPPGVFSTVTGGAAVGELLVRDERVAAIAQVGSTRAGEAISRAATATGAHVIRENGGNDALIVDEDVSPSWAAQQAALGCFANSGQICTSVERIFVHRGIANAFIVHLVSEARRLAATEELGPLVDGALSAAVSAQVTAAVASGARALIGGSPRDGAGSFYPATVLVDCTPDMTIMTEETFGPVAPICIVESFEEGLQLAAQDRYGLAATVLTASMSHAVEAAARLPVGTVKINAVFGGAPGGSAQPRGASGAGFGYGPGLLDELTTTKVVHIALPGEGSNDDW
jgi:acyl-CoA reductase-like NAD-dependent aldehyde dehydrogenase